MIELIAMRVVQVENRPRKVRARVIKAPGL